MHKIKVNVIYGLKLLKFTSLPHIRCKTTAALHQASITILFHRWTPQLCKVPLVALPRDVSALASRGQGRPSLRCICLQTQGRQLGRCLCRSDRAADGNKDRKGGPEGYQTIIYTSSRMDWLFPHVCICFWHVWPLLLSRSVKQFQRDAAQRGRCDEM